MTAATDVAPLTVTVDKAADLTSLSRRTIYELIQKGDLEVAYKGRRVLVKYASLVAFIDGLPNEPATA